MLLHHSACSPYATEWASRIAPSPFGPENSTAQATPERQNNRSPSCLIQPSTYPSHGKLTNIVTGIYLLPSFDRSLLNRSDSTTLHWHLKLGWKSHSRFTGG